MPASASASASASVHRPEDLITRLSSTTDDKLKALRELKNQIIGSRNKKLSYIKLGAVPSVVSILADGSSDSLLVQSAAAIGSFTCGFDAGVKAVLDAGAFPHLVSLISHSNDKTSIEQKALSDAGVLERLVGLLGGSLCQRDASLESLVRIIKGNLEVVSNFVGLDRYPRTRLLACMCLIVVRNTSPSYLQDVGTKTKLILILLELLDDPGQVGDEAAFSFSSLIAEKENLQKLAFEANVVDKLCNHLQKGPLQARRIQGILLALADLCSKLESCRSRLLSLQATKLAEAFSSGT